MGLHCSPQVDRCIYRSENQELDIRCEYEQNDGLKSIHHKGGFFFDQFVHLLEMMFEKDQSSVNSGLC